jgi:hypothetical protein
LRGAKRHSANGFVFWGARSSRGKDVKKKLGDKQRRQMKTKEKISDETIAGNSGDFE